MRIHVYKEGEDITHECEFSQDPKLKILWAYHMLKDPSVPILALYDTDYSFSIETIESEGSE